MRCSGQRGAAQPYRTSGIAILSLSATTTSEKRYCIVSAWKLVAAGTMESQSLIQLNFVHLLPSPGLHSESRATRTITSPITHAPLNQ
jgi:hypothetical protein